MTTRNGVWKQEFVTHFIAVIFNLDTDYKLRLVSAISGTLCIPAIYFVLKSNKWVGVLFIAFNPVFIFWSQLIRPYALGSFFIIMGWKYWWAYIPALATSVLSIVGIRILAQKKWVLAIVLGLMVVVFLMRPDTKMLTNVSLTTFIHLSRFYNFFMVSFILYFCDYIFPYCIKHLQPEKWVVVPIVLGIGYFFMWGIFDVYNNKRFNEDSTTNLWYRQEVIFSDWRNIGQVDYATEFENASWYGHNNARYFRDIYGGARIDSLLDAGDTLRIGLGNLAVAVSYQTIMKYIGADFYKRYANYVFNGGVVRVKLWKQVNKLCYIFY